MNKIFVFYIYAKLLFNSKCLFVSMSDNPFDIQDKRLKFFKNFKIKLFVPVIHIWFNQTGPLTLPTLKSLNQCGSGAASSNVAASCLCCHRRAAVTAAALYNAALVLGMLQHLY